MEAASRGAHEGGGRVLGITMKQFDKEPNRYLTEKFPSEHFYERLQRLITQSVGLHRFARGGHGNRDRDFPRWKRCRRAYWNRDPLVLLGECWQPIVSAWQQQLAVNDEDVRLLEIREHTRRSSGHRQTRVAAAVRGRNATR
jgi:hypothetical protein